MYGKKRFSNVKYKSQGNGWYYKNKYTMYKICSRRECSQLIKTESCRIWLLSWLSWDAWSLQDRAAGGKDQCLGLRSSLGAWFCSSPHTPGIPWPPLDIVANPASLPCRTVLCSEDLHSQISSVFCLKGRPLHHLRLAALFTFLVYTFGFGLTENDKCTAKWKNPSSAVFVR